MPITKQAEPAYLTAAGRVLGSPNTQDSVHELTVNGQSFQVRADADMPLLWVLRDYLGLVGTKYGCGIAQCGACTVHVNGTATRTCTLPVSAAAGAAITTVEGLSQGKQINAVQQAWLALDVPQCGYCQSGQIMSATALLARNAAPSDSDIDTAMAGNYCRCGTYHRIRKAVHMAAASLQTGVQYYDAAPLNAASQSNNDGGAV